MQKTIHFLSVLISITLFNVSMAAPVGADIYKINGQVIRNLTQEESNRQIVVNFYNGVFNNHDVAKSSEVLAENYIQHNPNVPNGKSPFVIYFTDLFKNNPNARSRIVRSAADGDLVYLHVHSTKDNKDLGRAIIDIFRVKDNRIVEHWDVVQLIPSKSANNNTMF